MAEPWILLSYEGGELDKGVTAGELAALLQSLSQAFNAAARALAGDGALETRRGRLPEDLAKVARFRIERIERGALVVEASPPLEASFAGDEFIDSDRVARLVIEKIAEVASSPRQTSASLGNIQRSARRVANFARRKRSQLTIQHNPTTSNLEPWSRTIIHQDEPPARLVEESALVESEIVNGRVFMVDIEPGRSRLRVVSSDGRHVTAMIDDRLRLEAASALNKLAVVTLSVIHTGLNVGSRQVQSILVIDDSLEQMPAPEALAHKQSIPDDPPDYAALAEEIWPTDEDAAAFRRTLAGPTNGQPSIL